MQQQLMQMQMQMQQPTTTTGPFNTTTITTDHIQQYLDENKALILKILENQNSGKLRECAENQTKLQRNLMYLAAIADSQPKPTSMYMQPPINYMQHQQSSQIVSQSHMLSQSPMMFAQPQQPQAFPALQQQALQTQLGINSVGMAGLQAPRSMTGLGGEGSGAYIDFSQSSFAEGGEGMSRQAQHSRNEENRSASSAEDEGNNPNKQGRFNRETNN